ncbi:MAG: hypothetical protein ABIP38_00915 [Steroidobacteraceae bacterium]
MGIAGLAQVAAQHLGSYAELVGLAASEYRASIRRRALLISAATAMASLTLVAAWATGLALLWDSPSRVPYCIGSALVCLVVTVVLMLMALNRKGLGPHGTTLRQEALQDLALLQEWRNSQ